VEPQRLIFDPPPKVMSEKIVQDFVKLLTDEYAGTGRPEDLPETVSFVQRARRGDMVRPRFEIAAEEEKWLHPRLIQFELVMGLQTRSEDVEEDDGVAGDVVTAWLAAVEDAFLANASATQDALDTLGARIKFIYPLGTAGVEPEGEGYDAEKRWMVRLLKS